MTGVLSVDQVNHFKREGFLSPLRGISSAEAAEYRRKIEEFEETSKEEVNKRLKIKGHLAFPWLVDLARDPRIVSAIQDLIGKDVLLFGCSVFAKNARDPRFVSWHQDSAYYGLDPHEEVTAWLALSRANSLSGCMKVIPRSHLGPDLVHEETYDGNNLLSRGQKVEADESLAVEMPLEPGEFSLHHERTVHGSPANMSDDRRIGIAFFYMPAHARSTLGRRSAMLVAGEDRHHHWDRDPEPKFDLDPEAVGFMESVWGSYRDDAVTKQSARTA